MFESAIGVGVAIVSTGMLGRVRAGIGAATNGVAAMAGAADRAGMGGSIPASVTAGLAIVVRACVPAVPLLARVRGSAGLVVKALVQESGAVRAVALVRESGVVRAVVPGQESAVLHEVAPGQERAAPRVVVRVPGQAVVHAAAVEAAAGVKTRRR